MSVLRCQGFLEALALLNGEASDLCASYELQRLPDAPDLSTALGLRVEDYALNVIEPARDLPAALWHIHAAPCGRAQLEQVCQRWFFSSRHMQAAPPGRFRAHLVAAFLESLDDALGGFSRYAVTMTPPMWYAIHWDEIAFERDGERYLLHFSHSD
ncbi:MULTISPECIES: hypothetical protein [unclassified Janthinobacterium]|uniref:hypothetical protein n=1 Tax=unclassified Janthinobacterium TaxID=2610881 RepID=UPI001E4E4636|nr:MULTISPECIES: hypothetical protein [unclassified Janthinobacterium]MCC7643968.1 hypothetical protein [Janthinobacterium sp. EB271-G4-3-1]MCC7692061.1 hypothetical protein [Janthinobacterium sp. EB271-G4-3-2]